MHFKTTIFFMIIFLLATTTVNAKEVMILTPDHALNTEAKLYENTYVNFDSSYNEWFFYSNWSVTLNMEHKEIFHIWDFNVEIDGEQIIYDPRPTARNRKILF